MLSLAGLIIGVILVANAQDGGYFQGKNPYLTSLPFFVALLGLLGPVVHCTGRFCSAVKRRSGHKRAELKVLTEVQERAAGIAITTKAAAQIARTTSAIPKVSGCLLMQFTTC